jgi:Glycosyl hydrolase family 71
MQRAKAMGIDAFALNIGVDPYTDTQLGFAYQSAANNNMKVFISFDFNWYNTGQASTIGAKIKQYASLPAQLKVDNKVFVSSFSGDGVDVGLIRSSAGVDLFFAPDFHPGQSNFGILDGALNWMAWDSNGNNKAPTPGHDVTVADGDNAYIAALNGESYLARKLAPH